VSKTSIITDTVKTTIKEVCPRTYHNIAPPQASYPLTTFTIREISREQSITRYQLELNAWGKTNLEEIDDLLDEIDEIMNFAQIDIEGGIIKIYVSGNRITIDDNEKSIMHKRALYELNYYERVII